MLKSKIQKIFIFFIILNKLSSLITPIETYLFLYKKNPKQFLFSNIKKINFKETEKEILKLRLPKKTKIFYLKKLNKNIKIFTNELNGIFFKNNKKINLLIIFEKKTEKIRFINNSFLTRNLVRQSIFQIKDILIKKKNEEKLKKKQQIINESKIKEERKNKDNERNENNFNYLILVFIFVPILIIITILTICCCFCCKKNKKKNNTKDKKNRFTYKAINKKKTENNEKFKNEENLNTVTIDGNLEYPHFSNHYESLKIINKDQSKNKILDDELKIHVYKVPQKKEVILN